MRHRLLLGFFLLTLISVVAAACQRQRASAVAHQPTAVDSGRGIVSVVGTMFEQRLMLRTDEHETMLLTTAADSAALSRLGGVEVVVRGWRAGGTFLVANFTAEKVDGRPVADGLIAFDGLRYSLATSTTRLLLGNPPDSFQRMIGARVWVGGPLSTGPNTFGVIVPAR